MRSQNSKSAGVRTISNFHLKLVKSSTDEENTPEDAGSSEVQEG